MTLRIDREQGRIQLSGELRCEHLDQLKAEIERCGSPVVLDLEELSLVDIEAIRFLNECEAKGISVQQCSPFIRTWMSRDPKADGGTPAQAEEGTGRFGR